jgi:K+ potassium transporter
LTTLLTSVLMFLAMREVWGWSLWLSAIVAGLFVIVDLSFVAANMMKVMEGGWAPLVVGATLFFLMSTWHRGRVALQPSEIARTEEPFCKAISGRECSFRRDALAQPHQFRTRNGLIKSQRTGSIRNENAGKSTNLTFILPLITVWLQVRVLPGSPVFAFFASHGSAKPVVIVACVFPTPFVPGRKSLRLKTMLRRIRRPDEFWHALGP